LLGESLGATAETVCSVGILYHPIGREKWLPIRETDDHPRFRDKADAVLMTGLSGLAELGGKIVQPAHGVITLIANYWPENKHNP
jgi:hypothetical protein